MLIDSRSLAVTEGPQTNTVSERRGGGGCFLAILALENRIGSQPLWLCQEGVGGNLCYMLPSIREHITSP